MKESEQKQQQQQQPQPQMPIELPYYYENQKTAASAQPNSLNIAVRKSISMESIPSNVILEKQPPTSNKPPHPVTTYINNTNGAVNNANTKFGTISGYSTANAPNNNTPQQRATILTKSNTSYFSTNTNNNSGENATATSTVESAPAVVSPDAQALANSRLRAINRSFRTAVDKSFDMPCYSGKFCKPTLKSNSEFFKMWDSLVLT